MPWTPLHAALGEPGNALTLELIQRACDERISERSDLDWKRDLPLTAAKGEHAKRLTQQADLAKDVAAMANSGGGMIVYGVDQSTVAGTSAADHIEPVGPVDETTIKTIRQVATGQVYPPVTGLDLLPVAPADASDQGVLVLLVPDSPDSPHLVHPRDRPEWFGAPYRHGPETDWMVERQVADAYRSREERRRRRVEDLDDRFDAFIESCGGRTDTHWVIAMAIPETPLPRPRALQSQTADRIIEHAWTQWPIPGGLGPKDLTYNEPTRRGLQRFIRAGGRTVRAITSAMMQARVEVHGDGAIAVAFTRDGVFSREPVQRSDVAIQDIEQTGVEFFALLWSAARTLTVNGDYMARIGVAPTTQLFRRSDPHLRGEFLPFDEAHRIPGYRPVDGPILASAGLDAALNSWFDLVIDAVNQTGVSSRLDAEEFLKDLHVGNWPVAR